MKAFSPSPIIQSDGSITKSSLIVLSLASLIAASTSSGLALLIGLSSWLVLLICSAVLWLVRPWLQKEALFARADSALTLTCVALLLACVVTVLSVIIQINRYEAFTLAGIWLPLIASNALIFMHLLGAWQSKDTKVLSAAWVCGAQYTAVLLMLAVLRELLGSGTILTNLHVFFPTFPETGITIINNYPRLKLFGFQAGGLLVLGLALAWIKQLRRRNSQLVMTRLPSDKKRVRVTGQIQ